TIVTNRFLGVPIFLGVMYAMFWITFSAGKYPMVAMANCFAALGEAVTSMWPAGHLVLLERLVVDGIIGGVGGVLVFLPNIMLLFMCIAFLEGTGYMSRAAFVMDGFMHVFGLHGKSFIPMLLGFGCSVPAVMATRTIESERDRMTTIMVVPFMSCSARLPIYAMMAPAFFSSTYSPFVGWLMYVIGTIVALLAARILKSTIFGGDDEVFVMELPPYRMPTLQSVLIQMWEREVLYIRKAGTLILGASVIIFLLSTFPVKKEFARDYRTMEEEVLKSSASEGEKAAELERIGALRKAELLEYSMTGKIGHALETLMRPLGFDWRVSSALVGAAAAKEIFVAQLGVLFASGDSGANHGRLQPMLAAAYTRLEGFCIMLFCLLTFPCIATLAAVKRETGSWKWVAFQIALFIGTAYIITLLVHQIGLHWH
ncbi:MAG: ferrous iron transport protein B, partial [Victivallaceae bacterium]|nr:ferrous iron transport protein B [Victivallaceae bacterium]